MNDFHPFIPKIPDPCASHSLSEATATGSMTEVTLPPLVARSHLPHSLQVRHPWQVTLLTATGTAARFSLEVWLVPEPPRFHRSPSSPSRRIASERSLSSASWNQCTPVRQPSATLPSPKRDGPRAATPKPRNDGFPRNDRFPRNDGFPRTHSAGTAEGWFKCRFGIKELIHGAFVGCLPVLNKNPTFVAF